MSRKVNLGRQRANIREAAMSRQKYTLCFAAAIALGACDKSQGTDQGGSAGPDPVASKVQAIVETAKEAGANDPTTNPAYTRIPTNKLVVAAIKRYMDEGDEANLTRRKDDLSSALANLPHCLETADTGCNNIYNGGSTTFNGSRYESPHACDVAERQACEADVDDMRKQLADFHYSSDQYVFSVVKTSNYEGNVISYVNLRVKGSDESETDKVVLQFKNSQWVVVDANAVNQ